MGKGRVPMGLKLLWTAWVLVWVPFYWHHYGPQNFLWFCDTANFGILAALWMESALVLSTIAVSVLLVQILWTIDLVGRVLLNTHLIGGSEYMFISTIPLVTRLLSLFHAAVPVVLLWGLRRLGYEGGINWVVGPFDKPQHVMPPLLYLLFCMAAYPIVLYAPTHFALRAIFRPRTPPPPAT